MAVFFRGTNAALGRGVGLFSILIALMALADGFVIGGILIAVAGAMLFLFESGRNSPAYSFGLMILYFGLVFVALMFIL